VEDKSLNFESSDEQDNIDMEELEMKARQM
jgi:hypothetical protein